MKTIWTSTAILLLCCNLHAQKELAEPLINGYHGPKAFLGVTAAYGRALMSSGDDNGSGEHARFGIAGQYFFVHLAHVDPIGYLTAQIGFGMNDGAIDYPVDNIPILDPEGEVTYLQIVPRQSISLSEIDALLGIGLKYKTFAADVSIVADILTTAETVSSMTIIDPPNAVFDTTLFQPGEVEYENGGKTIITGRYGTDLHTSLKWGVQIALKYMVTNIDHVQVQLVPYYRYYFNTIDLSGKTSLQVVALEVRVGIL